VTELQPTPNLGAGADGGAGTLGYTPTYPSSSFQQQANTIAGGQPIYFTDRELPADARLQPPAFLPGEAVRFLPGDPPRQHLEEMNINYG